MVKTALLALVVALNAEWPQWREPERDGKSHETGLLQKWPDAGPKLLWSVDGLGNGYSSVAVSGGAVYATGLVNKEEVLFAYDMQGALKWKKAYGPGWLKNYPSARTTPTVFGRRVFVISSQGRVVCMEAATGDEVWAVDTKAVFGARDIMWGLAESPLIDGKNVICTPGGPAATMAALDKDTGKTVWTTTGLNDTSAYCSPVLFNRGVTRLIVTMASDHIIGVDDADGKLLWSYPYRGRYASHANSPVLADGSVYLTSGYDDGGVMLNLDADGRRITEGWKDKTLDTHHGGVVLVDGYIYGSSWMGNDSGNWVCVELKTGKVMYDTQWMSKGQIIYADGMLYCYEEKSGKVGLAKATPSGFNVISSFSVTKGAGEHWAHPAISDGRLYIRHGDSLMVYDIKNP